MSHLNVEINHRQWSVNQPLTSHWQSYFLSSTVINQLFIYYSPWFFTINQFVIAYCWLITSWLLWTDMNNRWLPFPITSCEPIWSHLSYQSLLALVNFHCSPCGAQLSRWGSSRHCPRVSSSPWAWVLRAWRIPWRQALGGWTGERRLVMWLVNGF